MPSSKKKPLGKDERLAILRDTALAKLDVDALELAQAPPISDILNQAVGGIPAVIAALRFSDDSNAQAFLKVYDEATTSDRKVLPLEAFCLLAEVDIPQLLGAAVIALRQQSAKIVTIIATTSHPATVRARVRNALKPSGYRDRNALDTALRFLPQPKGTTTIIHTGSPDASSAHTFNPEDVDTDDLFPDLAETQKMLTSGDV